LGKFMSDKVRSNLFKIIAPEKTIIEIRENKGI
jgi:hypothetical protein